MNTVTMASLKKSPTCVIRKKVSKPFSRLITDIGLSLKHASDLFLVFSENKKERIVEIVTDKHTIKTTLTNSKLISDFSNRTAIGFHKPILFSNSRYFRSNTNNISKISEVRDVLKIHEHEDNGNGMIYFRMFRVLADTSTTDTVNAERRVRLRSIGPSLDLRVLSVTENS